MNKTVSLLLAALMVVVVTLPTAESVKCYVCSGYNPESPPDDKVNTENCPQDTLNVTALAQEEGPQCKAVLRDFKGVKITERMVYTGAIPDKTRDDDDYVTLKGYLCGTDLCNNQDPDNAAPATAFSLPLLLLPLLSLLPRRLG